MSEALVINGNPKKSSLCKGLAESYKQGFFDAGGDVEIVHISELDFDMNLKNGYNENQVLEGDLKLLQTSILKSLHIVIISPVWWGTIPAKLKGLFDRVFLPGFAFEFTEGKSKPEKLLKGKTARLIVTMDTPVWYYRLFLGDPIIKALKKPTLELCGIRVKNICRFGPVLNSSDTLRKKWIRSVRTAGIEDSTSIKRITKQIQPTS